jgi:alanine racemase
MKIPEAFRTWCEVDLAALRHNVRTMRTLPGSPRGVMGVVKANAYGHGALPVARELVQNGVDWLGVAHVAEGLELREAGLTQPILLLSATLPSEMKEAISNDLTLTISSHEELRALKKAARAGKKQASLFLKIDTGMGRLGCLPHAAAPLIREALAQPLCKIHGICTHFSSAENDPRMTRAQAKLFESWSDLFDQHHTSNSAAVLSRIDPTAQFSRLGISLYGCSPIAREQKKLRPVLSWKARVTLVKTFPSRWPISYGATYVTKPGETIAVLAVGYGDGYFRSLSGQSHVLIHGKRCPLRGRVTMDQIMVDVSNVPHVKAGDIATLIGTDQKQTITAIDLANQVGTISYEILCHIQIRVPRIYLNKTS